MSASFSHFGIIGAGAWGTALALTLCRAERHVSLWARHPSVAENIDVLRENRAYLPGIKLDPAIQVTAQFSDLAQCDALILAVPAQHVRATCAAMKGAFATPKPIVIVAKGIELGSHKLMSEIVSEFSPHHPLSILSGPSFAHEIARGLPAALTLASEHDADALAMTMSTPAFRLYITDDIIGTQIGGALKNVLAVACGIVVGRALGENAKAALITRGLAEMMRLGTALGARTETLMGLSGVGDAVLTCSSSASRNMSLGIALGKGESLDAVLTKRTGVTEGISTATAALGLAHRHGIDMPVARAVDMILREKAGIDQVIAGLLARPLRNESS